MSAETVSSSRLPAWVWPAAIFVGAFWTNAVPHLVMGITGQDFPTVFSGMPPAVSPPWLNVVWSLVNVALGALLWRAVKPWRSLPSVRWTILASGAVVALLLSLLFTGWS